MTLRTFRRIFGYNELVLKRKPVLNAGEDLRDLPTYTIPEAALSLGIAERTLRSWCLGSNPLFDPPTTIGKIPLLSFRDLVDVHIVQTARKYHDVPMSRIKSALETARNHGNAHPLQDDRIRIFAKCLVIIEPGRGRRKRAVWNISRHGQTGIPQVVDLYTRRISKDRQGNPIGLYPSRLWEQDGRKRPVAIHPNVMSGRLVVTGTRIPVALLKAEALAGKLPKQLAKDYRLSTRRVEEALSHFDTKAA
jgi:uncharacterized protein (DUF433 family)/DNA-binding transcriptional MerR regulator